MRAFAERLRGMGYAAVWATLEEGQGVTETAEAEPVWLTALERAGGVLEEGAPDVTDFLGAPPGTRLGTYLHAWAERVAPKPLVLLLDEADTVSGPALVSLLRQLRAGFTNRGMRKFPDSIALIGMRDLRETLTSAKDGVQVNPGSPFNIKSASLTLRNFSPADVAALYQQHSDATGQLFTPEALERAFYWSQGQPFLVNVLADLCVRILAPDGEAVTAAHIDQAKERLIQSRTTHLDSLAQRLKEPRVARVVEAVLLGDMDIPYSSDDYLYCVDLGLLRNQGNGAEPANPLYREVLARVLTEHRQENLPRPWWRWQTPEGKLDMPALMEAFFEWWRENAEIVEERAEDYHEAVPHITMMAFLQRVVNGGGQVQREYAGGRMAVDLVVVYGKERHVIELKRVPPKKVSPERVRSRGIQQLSAYLDKVGEKEGWLIIFDQRPGLSWEAKLWAEEVELDGKHLHVRGG